MYGVYEFTKVVGCPQSPHSEDRFVQVLISMRRRKSEDSQMGCVNILQQTASLVNVLDWFLPLVCYTDRPITCLGTRGGVHCLGTHCGTSLCASVEIRY